MNNLTSITTDQVREAREALSRPANLAEGLPGRFYGESFYAIEQEKLFPRTWCAVTVASAIPNPGDVLPVDLAGWPIIVVRGRDGAIRAFHNICRHRAMQLVREPCNKSRFIRCPWHSWSYDLEGALVATPEVGGAGVNTAEGFDKSSLGLKSISVGQWLDYIFVNIDGQAPPFAEHIQPAVTLLKDLNLDDLRHGGRHDEVYGGNWKLSIEGGIEDYHLPFGHPQLKAHISRNTTPCFADGVYVGGWVDIGLQSDNAGSLQTDAANGRLPRLLTRECQPFPKTMVLNLFPTGMILLGTDNLKIGMLLPDGPARTKVELHLYYTGDAATSPDYQGAREAKLDRWRQVLPQDSPFIEGAQATIRARDVAGIRTRFSPYWEQTVLRFQRMVLDALS